MKKYYNKKLSKSNSILNIYFIYNIERIFGEFMLEVNSFELKVGMSKQEFLQANKDLPNAPTIFEAIDSDGSKTIEEKEYNAYSNTKDENRTLANPKMESKIEKLNKKNEEYTKKLDSLDSQIVELEKIRNSQSDPKEIKNINKQLKGLYNTRNNLITKLDKLSAKAIYLTEVKVSNNVSDKDLSMASEQYMQQRNQLNPYYAEYMKIGAQMDTEENPEKKAKLLQQWRVLEQLVSSWHPTEQKSSEISNTSSINIDLNTKGDIDKNTESLSVSGNTSFKNHTLTTNAGITKENDETANTHSTNVNAGINYQYDINENNNISVNSSYTNYTEHSPESKTERTGVNSSVSFSNTAIKNVTLSANYSNDFSKTKMSGSEFDNIGYSRNNSGGISFNHNLKQFNYGAGVNINNTNSGELNQTTYSTPLNASINFGKPERHNKFSLNGSFTPTFGKDVSSQDYNVGFGYSYTNDKIALNTNSSFGYQKANLSGETFSVRNQTDLTNLKYGYSANLSFNSSKSNFYKMYDASAKFTTPMSDNSKLTIGGGYNSNDGTYGEIGLSFNLTPHKRKPEKN